MGEGKGREREKYSMGMGEGYFIFPQPLLMSNDLRELSAESKAVLLNQYVRYFVMTFLKPALDAL